jgi:hypothetical protein
MQSVASSTLSQIKNSLSLTLRTFYKPFDACITWIKVYQRDKRLLAVANEYCKQMTLLEMTPIKDCNLDETLSRAKTWTINMGGSEREEVKKATSMLTRHIVALECRNKKTHTPDESYYNEIAQHAQAWKKSKLYFLNKNLAERDIKKLKEACHYAGFAQVLLADPECREEFFRWTILNDSKVCPFHPNDVAVFIKFPGLHQEILDTLGFRNARFGGNLFQVDEKDQLLTLPLEGKRVKVIHNAHMEVKGHQGIGKMTVSFQDIFRELKNKTSYDGVGEFEITDKGGIWLWNAKKLAYYHEDLKIHKHINLEGDGWINHLPTEETLTYKEAEERYKIKMEAKPDGFEGDFHTLQYSGFDSHIHPLFNLAGTQKEKYDFLGTHAFNKFLLVDRKSKTVEVKSLGEFIYPFPLGAGKLLWALTKYHASYMYSPDENIFNANRQHAGDYTIRPVIVRANPQEWVQYTRSLKKDIINGWKGKLGFNFLVAQCTTKIWKRARKHFGVGRIPDLRVRFWKLHPRGAMNKLYSCLKSLPERISIFVLFLLGSWRQMRTVNKNGEKTTVSLLFYNRPFKYIVHPAGLFDPLDPDMTLPA